ncbi:head maturation protease, ClpP-related [Paenibacillus sp. FSL F4-0097]|uniref:head maturation protease, ClpP-related n=1 Tax=Paenibacillus sp. FSL F4-0097 TaxID=2921369 RepID=UPI0031597F44
MSKKKYWTFKNQANNEADLYLYLEIASWGGGYAAHSAKSFKAELDALGEISTINVYINSPGGDVFEGRAIYNMLKRHKAFIRVHIDGLAASIAAYIAMAADELIMPNNAMLMIHNAWMNTSGNAKELREAADMLDKVGLSMRQDFLLRAGDKLDEETLTNLLDVESWLTAQEALDYGLCDVVTSAKQIAALADTKLLAKYRNVPNDITQKEEPPTPENGFSEEKRKEIARNASLELQNLQSYLGGIING